MQANDVKKYNNGDVVPAEILPKLIGKAVHLKWAPQGCVWILEAIKGDEVLLYTPKTLKSRVAKVSDVTFTHREADRINLIMGNENAKACHA